MVHTMPVPVFLIATLLALASVPAISTSITPGPGQADPLLLPLAESDISRTLATMEGWFSGNRGQVKNPEIRFVHASSSYSIGFLRSGYLITLRGVGKHTSVLRVTFEGANPVEPEGWEELSHRSNYFIGNDSAAWRTNVPNYKKMVYRELYHGIDLVFSTTAQGLKYDFLVSPGARPEEIRYFYEGVDDVSTDAQGRLHITTPSGGLVEDAPFSYQVVGGKEQEISSSYLTDGSSVGFTLGNYDPTTALVIDPLLYSSFFGGEKADHGYAITLDSGNNVYVTGETRSPDFPTTPGCFDDTQDEYGDVFVFKLSLDSSTLLFSTFIGGTNGEGGNDITVDSENNTYLTGVTSSSDFPITSGCLDDSHNGNNDAFVCKLNSDGSDLLYSTFIGGGSQDRGESIVIDSDNDAYVTGATGSSDFPISPGCFDDSYNGGYDVFVVRLNSNASSFRYSTFIGGDNEDVGKDIVLDLGNNAYITGWTASSDFPVDSRCFDFTFNGYHDVFVCKLSHGGSSLRYSTFVGDESWDSGMSLVLDNVKNVYVTGTTDSPDFPTTEGAFDERHNGGYDAFVCKLDSNGEELVYSSFIGGSKSEKYDTSIALDPEKNVYITGDTYSSDFPTSSGCFDDSYNGEGDVFVCKLNQDGSTLLYSTFLGGSYDDWGFDIVLDQGSNAYVAGDSYSPLFPTTPYCFDDEHNGGSDVFVCKLNPGRPVAKIDFVSSTFAQEGERIWFYGNGTDDEEVVGYLWTSSIDDVLSNEQAFNTSALSNGTHTISFKVRDNYDTWSEDVVVNVTINGIPRAKSVTIEPSPANESRRTRFHGSGVDDGTIVSYSWRSSQDGEFYNGEEEQFYYSNLSKGFHTIYFKVQDNHGLWSDDVSTSLKVNDRPEAIIVSISPNPALDTDSIRFRGYYNDDGSILRYVWSSSMDGEFNNGTAKEFDCSNLSKGFHTIYLRVQDNDLLWSEDVISTLLVHHKPTATLLSLSPNPALDVEIVTFSGKGSGDATIERYLWTSSIDGELYNGTKDSFSLSRLSAGNHSISLRVQDSYGAWSDEAETLLTINKYIPTNKLPTVTITSPENGSELRGLVGFSGRAFDEDDGVVRVELSIGGGEWLTVDGTIFWNYEWDTTKGGNGEYVVRVKSFDGTNYSKEAVWVGVVTNDVAEDDGDGGALMQVWVLILLGAVGLACVVYGVKKVRRPVFTSPGETPGNVLFRPLKEPKSQDEKKSLDENHGEPAPAERTKATTTRKRCPGCRQLLRIGSSKRPLMIICPSCHRRYKLSR